ncbi:MAG TPA: 2'-5' RNA ligase family protein [Streptosporangiaceae bacterium]
MNSLPSQMANRWECRAESAPRQGKLHWHILFRDHPQVQALASIAQDRLAHFSGLHFTPRQWLHVTTLIVGFAEDFTATEIDDMIARARQLLSEIPSIKIVFGKVLYHPEGIVLGIRPDNALSPVFEAVRSATRIATGGDGITERQPWTPHVTLAYSTSVQPASPIIAALGRELPSCQVTINRINLIVQEGAERLWNWRSIAEVPFGA